MGVLDVVLALFTTANQRFSRFVQATSAFQAARSRPRQIGLVEVFSTINLCLNLLKLQ
jgi:hypothetical protein